MFSESQGILARIAISAHTEPEDLFHRIDYLNTQHQRMRLQILQDGLWIVILGGRRRYPPGVYQVPGGGLRSRRWQSSSSSVPTPPQQQEQQDQQDDDVQDVQLIALRLPQQPVRQVMIRVPMLWSEDQVREYAASRFIIPAAELDLRGAVTVREHVQDPSAISRTYLPMRPPARSWNPEVPVKQVYLQWHGQPLSGTSMQMPLQWCILDAKKAIASANGLQHQLLVFYNQHGILDNDTLQLQKLSQHR